MTIDTKLKKKLLPGALVVMLLAGAGIAIETVFPYIGIKPRRMIPAENLWRFPNGCTLQDFSLKGRKVNITTPDSTRLSAWLIDSNRDTTFGAVVLLHGISACKEVNLQRAKLLADSGYASLLVDLRGHGESGGEFCTFGYYEKQDLSAVSDSLAVYKPGLAQGIWGASLGGAIALQAMEVQPRYQFGVIESTFDEYPKVAEEYGADYMFGLRSRWLLNHILSKAGAIARFDPYSVMPVKSAAAIHRPVLFMHGDKDSRIPLSFNKRNFEAVPNDRKEWVTVPGAGHNNLWQKDGEHLKQVVSAFLARIRP